VPIVRALANRNFRLYFSGQIISVVGTWMQQIALSWLVYRLTGSTAMLGLVGFAGQIPNLFLAPLGGVIADRHPRRRLLVLTTAAQGVQALGLALLVHADAIGPWGIVAMATMLGIINGIDQPIRQSFVPELVEKRGDIANAVALNSFTLHSSRFIGPVLGGLVVARFGEAACFTLNALSYVGVMIALMAMNPRPVPAVHRSVGDALREGLAYVRNHDAIRLLLLIVTVMALFSGSYQTLLPYFARDVYHGDVRSFGLMTAAGGLGACLGTIFLASHRNPETLELRIVSCGLIVSLVLAGFAVTHNFPLALAAMLVMSFCSINTVAASSALINSLVDYHMRGRVMAIYTMAFFGMSPVGNLLVGWLAPQLGVETTLLGCAAAIFAMAAFAIYARRSIDFSLPAAMHPL
jgi:MFS family permease